MRLDAVTATNFMSHRETALDVTIGPRVRIDGENGSGKTSISVDALLWALFKKSRSVGAMDQLKGPWGNAMSVSVKFHVKGHDYQVTRTTGSKSELEMLDLTTGNDMSEKHVTMTQGKIIDLIGTYETFVNTAIFRQGDALRFGTMRPEERRTLFEELQNMQEYADIESKARKGRTAAAQQIEVLTSQILQMENWETDLADAKGELGTAESTLEAARAALDDEQQALDDASAELLEMEEATKQRNMVAASSQAEELKFRTAKSQLQIAVGDLGRLRRIAADLSVSLCPACKKPLNAEEIESQRLDNSVMIDKAENTLAQAQRDVVRFEGDWNSKRTQVEAIDDELRDKFKHAREIQQYSSAKLPALRTATDASRSHVDRLTGKIGGLEANLVDKPRVADDLAEQQKRIRGYELIAEAFSKRGIPRELMRGFASEVEKATNALLQSLGGATVEIKLDKEGVSKHGVTEGTVDVWFTDAGPTRKVEMLSGGEKTRAMTALRLGIAQAMARRTDKAIRTLLLDESLDGLDQRGKDDLMTMLDSFDSTSFQRLVFITHDPAIAGLFPDRIALAKASDGATMVL